jgi:hypothetical protein
MARAQRSTIPLTIADEVLFASDHTCCICRVRNKDVQIHHIDGNPVKDLARRKADSRRQNICGSLPRFLNGLEADLRKARYSGIGRILRVASVTIPSVPSAPQKRWVKS